MSIDTWLDKDNVTYEKLYIQFNVVIKYYYSTIYNTILNTIYICVCVYIYILILSSLEKEGNPNICDNMDKPWGHYAKWNKSDKDKYGLISLIHRV